MHFGICYRNSELLSLPLDVLYEIRKICGLLWGLLGEIDFFEVDQMSNFIAKVNCWKLKHRFLVNACVQEK